MKLTPEVLRAAYNYLAETEPFCTWNLPDGEDVVFRVLLTRAHAGSHCKGFRNNNHYIDISASRVGSTAILMAVMAHEMVHAFLAHHKISDTSDHGPTFKKYAALVCKRHIFDPKEFG